MAEKAYPTAHINATPEDFGRTVLMPGDPLRAKFIAETYLENPRLVNSVRGINGYTGTWKGTKVSVMASGMGMPSIGIYSYELFNFFGVDNILRIGSAGALREDVHMREQFRLVGNLAPLADYRLLRTAADVCEEMKLAHHVGNIYSSDVFYNDDFSVNARWGELGALAVEMEAAALYINAAKAGKRALAICTVSDHLLTGEQLSSEERQCGFRNMMEVALEVAVRMEKEPKL